MRFARFQQHLRVALCGMTFAALFLQRSSAQQITYYDFNAPQATPSQSSTACGSIAGGPAANNVLFCFNYEAGGVNGISYISDTYPPSIDPNASTDGDTGSTNYALQLTQNAGSQASSMWYSIPQDVKDGFTVWYAVKLTPSQASYTADGIAFVIQNAAGGEKDNIANCSETGSGLTVLGAGGGCMGYGGIDNSVALEMDTYANQWDPAQNTGGSPYQDNHVALQGCGPGNPNSPAHNAPTNCLITLDGTSTLIESPITSAAPGATPSAVTLADGNPHQIVIVYNGTNDAPANYLYVYLDPEFNPGTHTPVAGSTPLFSGPFDITKFINLSRGTAYFGFTSATGYSYEQHELMGFTFTPHNFSGNVNVCPPGQSTPTPCNSTLPVTFTVPTTTFYGTPQVVTQGIPGLDFQLGSGSTCSDSLSAGSSCTVNVTFSPRAPGLRLGAVNLLDNNGNVLATKLIYGTGEGPVAAFSPLTTNALNFPNSPLSQPKGVVVDAAGDLFIADTGNSRVVKVASGTWSTAVSGLASPQGLAIDGAGDLFIADSSYGGSGAVVEVPPGCTTSACWREVYATPAPPQGPVGVAVDGVGDVFFADNPRGVFEIPAGCSSSTCQITVGSGWSQPAGVALDAAGDLFVADSGLPGVVEFPAGCASSSCQTKVGYGWSQPEGVAVDAAGDVFVADAGLNSGAGQIVEVPAGCTRASCQIVAVDNADSSSVAVDAQGDIYSTNILGSYVAANLQQGISLNFPNIDVGTASTAQSLTFQNVGNQRLNAVSPGLVFTDSDFGQASGLTALPDCNADFSLVPSGACNISIEFAPLTGSPNGTPLSGTTVFTDNSMNAASVSQTISLSGTGLASSYTIGGTVSGLLGSGLVLQDNGGNDLAVSNSSSFTFSATVAANSPYSVTVLTQPTNPLQDCTVSGGSGTATANVTTVLVTCTTVPVYPVTLTETGTGSGTVTDSQGQITCSETSGTASGMCTASFPTNTMDTLTATASAGSTFLGWGGSCASAGTSPTCIVTIVNMGLAPTATFSPASPATANPLSLLNNYFVTGDYASAGVSLRGTGQGGVATGMITIPDLTTCSCGQGVPDGADIVDAFLFWQTIESSQTASTTTVTFQGFSVAGQQIGSDLPYTDTVTGLSGTLRAYRANINQYFPVAMNQVRYGSGQFTVALPDSGGTGLPLAEGASMVVIYRVISPNFPLKSVVIYNGSTVPSTTNNQVVEGFYDSADVTNAGESTVLSAAGGSWNNSSSSVTLPPHSSQYTETLNPGNAYAAVILSTPVSNSDNDGILDAWKTGPISSTDLHYGDPGYYEAKTGTWVGLPGATHNEKDLFVQFDYMCSALLADNVSCDFTQPNLYPSPDANGNDPLAMVTQAFANIGVHVHLIPGNAILESTYTCTDNLTSSPPQLCEFPSTTSAPQPGVVAWNGGLELSKIWPVNYSGCTGSPSLSSCTPRFQYGQKDSYHYVMFAYSLAIPAWNSWYGSLKSITVTGGASSQTTLVTTGLNGSCPSRVTISGVLEQPSLNGVYNNVTCDGGLTTMTVSTPNVPEWTWTYANNAAAEPVIGVTSGTVTGISGYSNVGGSDSVVSLGLWESSLTQNMSKSATVIAGTLFHELGHTLGLTHGGRYYDGTNGSYVPTYEANCKPNYQSSMNYLFQLDGLGPKAAIAYSNQTLYGEPQGGQPGILAGDDGTSTFPTIPLTSAYQLTDSSGNFATYPTTSWYTSTAPSSTASPATMHCDGSELDGDTGYRVTGNVDPVSPQWSATADPNIAFDGTTYTQLRGYDDVTSLDLRQIGATSGEFAALASSTYYSSAGVTIGASGVTFGGGGGVTFGGGGGVTFGGGGGVTFGGGGGVTFGGGGGVTFGGGGGVTFGGGGGVTFGGGGGVTFGGGGGVTFGGGGGATTELDYSTANSVVRPPSSPTMTPVMTGSAVTSVKVDWTAPVFGVVQSYTVFRSSDGATPIEIGVVNGVGGYPPVTEFIDSNPDTTSTTVLYTISTTLVPDSPGSMPRSSAPSTPAVMKNEQNIVLGPLPSSVTLSSTPPTTITATAIAYTNGVPNGLQVNFVATGPCSVASQSITGGVSSAVVTLLNQGTCTISASQPGTNPTPSSMPPYYDPANSVSGQFMILPAGSTTQSQTIMWSLPATLQYGSSLQLSAIAESNNSPNGLPVTFSAPTSGPCTVTGTIVTTNGVGQCTITVKQAGTSTYSAAMVSQSIEITPAVLTVTALPLTATDGQPLPSLSTPVLGTNYSFGPFVNGDTYSVVSGTPVLTTNATSTSPPGTYAISISTGSLAAANYSFLFVPGTLTLDQAPTIISANTTTFMVGAAGTFAVMASGYPASMTYSYMGTLPSGVTLSTAGVLSGTPAAGTGGSYSITITASNGITPAGTQNFTLVVDQALAITSVNNATFKTGASGSFDVTGTGYPAPTYTETGELPSGVTLSTAGVLSGTPAAGTGGVYAITIVASDGVLSNATQNFTLTVDQAPTITSANTTTFTVGAAGTFAVMASGYPASMTYSYMGTLPSGVTLSTAGVLSGTPAAGTGGSYSITITASNGTTTVATQSFTLIVDQAPTITSATSTTFTVGKSGTFTVTASGYPAPAITESGSLPGGVTFSTGNGTATLSGTPTASGIYAITFTAKNAVSTATQSFTLTSETTAPSSGTTCNGVYTGTFSGNITVSSGQNCIFESGGATGNITESGGNLSVSNATIGGNISISGGTYTIGPSTTVKGNLTAQSVPTGSAQNQICGTSVAGSLVLQSVGTAATVGSGTTACATNTIGGSLTLQANSAVMVVSGNTVVGSLTDQSNTASTTVSGNEISGSVTDQGNSGASVISSNTITGTLVVQSNRGTSTLLDNTVNSSLTDQGNTGATTVTGNHVKGNLVCQSNTSISGSGDTAAKLEGQCASF